MGKRLTIIVNRYKIKLKVNYIVVQIGVGCNQRYYKPMKREDG